jgi:hypothetical protein
LSLNGKNYVVGRTGYYEREVVDYSLRNVKADGSLTYAFHPDVTISYSYRFADLDNVYQRSNRFRLDNYRLQQHGLAFQNQITAGTRLPQRGEHRSLLQRQVYVIKY